MFITITVESPGVCITKREKAESEAQRGKPKGTLDDDDAGERKSQNAQTGGGLDKKKTDGILREGARPAPLTPPRQRWRRMERALTL